MGKVSYILDIGKLGEAYNTKEYSKINSAIINRLKSKSYFIEENGILAAYDIRKNIPLSTIYSTPVWVVDFLLKDMDILSNTNQEKIIENLLVELKKEIIGKKGYYTFRVPSKFVDLLTVFNKMFNDSLFCGGNVIYTTELTTNTKASTIEEDNRVSIFFADKDYICQHRENLIDISEKSFQKYQGQYHIAPFTKTRAGQIYKNWIKKALETNEKFPVLVAEFNDEVVGFCTYEETEECYEGVLASVSDKYRGIGVYNKLIYSYIQLAKEHKKLFVAGTQIDNYVVQRSWIKMGMYPCETVYFFHYNNLNRQR